MSIGNLLKNTLQILRIKTLWTHPNYHNYIFQGNYLSDVTHCALFNCLDYLNNDTVYHCNPNMIISNFCNQFPYPVCLFVLHITNVGNLYHYSLEMWWRIIGNFALSLWENIDNIVCKSSWYLPCQMLYMTTALYIYSHWRQAAVLFRRAGNISQIILIILTYWFTKHSIL